MRATCVVVTMFAAMVVTVAAQNPMKPGMWVVTMKMEMPNMPMQMPETKVNQCITSEHLKTPAGMLPTGGPGSPGANGCKVSDHKTTGNTVSWKMSCPAPQKMDGTAEVTFTDETYTGKMTMTTDKGTMNMNYAAKRVGDCK